MSKKIPCPDCGDAPVSHPLEWLTAAMDSFMIPLSKPTDGIWHAIEPVVGNTLYNHIGPLFFQFMTLIGLGTITKAPNEKTGGRARVLWDEATRRGIRMWEFHLFGVGREAFVATYNGRTKCFSSLPRPGVSDSKGIAWMDDKEVMREKFAAAGIPISRGGKCFLYARAKHFFDTLEKPLVIKPHTGSRSRHTTTHITTEAELKRAFYSAKQLSPWIIVEEEDQGFVYRGTLIGGKVAGVLRREPPDVTGDGVHTVRELVELENKNPKRTGDIFHTILKDKDAETELARQNLTWESIPSKDSIVTLSQKASRGIGGGTTDVTDIAHPENIKMLEHIAEVVGDPIIGVDFILSDIEKPWQEQKHASVLECNSLPFIDLHHFPLHGSPRNVAGMIWDMIFPELKK